MRWIISQPMKGKSKEEILKEREECVNLLKKDGHSVKNRVADYNEIEMMDGINKPLYFLAHSIEAMSMGCDGVVFLPGWDKARGCRIEHQCAVEYGFAISYFEDGCFTILNVAEGTD